MDADILFTNAIEHWKENKGIGTALIPPPLNDKVMILGVLQRMYIKSPDAISLIIVNNFTERNEIVEFLTHQDDEDNNNEFKRLINTKHIKIFTVNFMDNYNTNVKLNVAILYHCEEICDSVFNVFAYSKFRLAVLNNLRLTPEDIAKLYSVCPLLSDFKQTEIDAIRTSTPVEEMRIGIDMPIDSEEYKLLQYYDEYISTSINIFGNLDNIQYALFGDERVNISSTQFCFNLAAENGWNERLDMSIELNVQIDALYNPANIRERASKVYEMIRNRERLVTDYIEKLDTILNIVKENPDKHILIINKYGEFAAKITKYLNDMSEHDICGDYHDRVEPIPACSLDGTPIFVKSGVNKGERKMYAYQAQKTYNEKRFNNGYIHILSTNNTPDKDLRIPIDIIIITSPKCEDIESYIYRLSNVSYPSNVITLYSLYVRNTIEDKAIQNKNLSATHILLKSNEKSEKSEENFNFIVAD